MLGKPSMSVCVNRAEYDDKLIKWQQKRIKDLSYQLERVMNDVRGSWESSPEGRAGLKEIERVLFDYSDLSKVGKAYDLA